LTAPTRTTLFVSFLCMPPRPPRPTLFPYTTLFRSRGERQRIGRLWDEPQRGRRHWRQRDGPRNPGHGARADRNRRNRAERPRRPDRKSTRLNSSHVSISYAVFCLKKKKNKRYNIIR